MIALRFRENSEGQGMMIDRYRRLITLLSDERPAVVQRAARRLAHSFADEKSLTAVRQAMRRRQMPESLRAVLQKIVTEIENKTVDEEN